MALKHSSYPQHSRKGSMTVLLSDCSRMVSDACKDAAHQRLCQLQLACGDAGNTQHPQLPASLNPFHTHTHNPCHHTVTNASFTQCTCFSRRGSKAAQTCMQQALRNPCSSP